MADKRMFSSAVVTSDAFLDMPADAQALYFQLGMAADDRGFCDRPRMIMRMMRASDDTMKLLIAKKFVLIAPSNSQIVVIKHWRINNNMRSERFKETKYLDVLQDLFYDENKSYSLNHGDGHYPVLSSSDNDLLPIGTQAAPNGSHRIDKSRVEEKREEESRGEENSIFNNTDGCIAREENSEETSAWKSDLKKRMQSLGYEPYTF